MYRMRRVDSEPAMGDRREVPGRRRLASERDQRTHRRTLGRATYSWEAERLTEGDVALARRLETPRPVPRRLHFIWLGNPMRDTAVDNVAAWAERAASAGWSVHLWTDPVNRSDPEGRDFSLPLSAGQQDRLTAAGVDIRPYLMGAFADGGASLDPRTTLEDAPHVTLELHRRRAENRTAARRRGEISLIRQMWRDAYRLRAFNYLSDLARYTVLHAVGGMYVDVDIGPGSVDLGALEGPLSAYEIPLYAPRLRDLHSLTRSFEAATHAVGADVSADSPLGSRLRGERARRADTTSMPRTMLLLANARPSWDPHDGLVLNNNLLMAQRHNEVLRRLIARLTSRSGIACAFLGRRTPGTLAAEAGFVSGPIALQEHIDAYLEPFSIRAGAAPDRYRFLDRSSEERRTHLWRNVRWLTAESEILSE